MRAWVIVSSSSEAAPHSVTAPAPAAGVALADLDMQVITADGRGSAAQCRRQSAEACKRCPIAMSREG
jgi:hypothetical protein